MSLDPFSTQSGPIQYPVSSSFLPARRYSAALVHDPHMDAQGPTWPHMDRTWCLVVYLVAWHGSGP